MGLTIVLLAVLSIWDYPARQPRHEQLRRQFMVSMRAGDTAKMLDACRAGANLLPDDPTWRYNLACSLAYFKDKKPALDALEEAIDLGFRDVEAIKKDNDLKQLKGERRFDELIEYARQMKDRPILTGPMASVPATGVFGQPISLGEQNLGWDFDNGCFEAKLRLAVASAGGNTGDLYMNRDAQHSPLKTADYPGLTEVKLDQDGRNHGMDLNLPNILFPYPVFGNCSRAYVMTPFWRSIARAATTTELGRLRTLAKMYLSNQVWVFPSNADTPPVGTNGDVFASITPYFITTAGRSFSDIPYVRLALEASRSFDTETKKLLVKSGMLAPTIITLIRKSFNTVSNETDYLSAKAHPTAFPPQAVNPNRLAAMAAKLKPSAIPPLAIVSVSTPAVQSASPWPECVYATGFAWSFILRAPLEVREFTLRASGAAEFAFVQTHGKDVEVKIERIAPNTAKVVVNRRGMSPTNRVDIAVFGRNPGTEWGAPSYVSFAVTDPKAPYSDPFFTMRPELKAVPKTQAK